ncbi:bacillithiol biosynthesis cysteine-adding enzyme BshC [Vaginella massiliensis]|uniref:bacillithiol biosynthesis cysteine-adding enzyme BshC n=1 Tax=Vaginella massiliensis TaxID=1816680 RepID=UPI00083983EE|nr:bacillithiol biosynthesis cysteine-adding enzyme BshC [Vaginella massiliensis]
MINNHISIEESPIFSTFIKDYLAGKKELKPFYAEYPNEQNLLNFAKTRSAQFTHRSILRSVLQAQLGTSTPFPKQTRNLEKLEERTTVTITTGHQLNLFTGPVFFFYKILQTIKMCDELNNRQTDYFFVPIYWMATEDHDFDEINHFYYDNRKLVWNCTHGGAVGKLNLDGLEEVFESFLHLLPKSERKNELAKLIENSYAKANNLAEATRMLVQQLFGEFGLLTLDGDDLALKRLMIPVFEKELTQRISFDAIEETNSKLEDLGYNVQVHPREINLFYLTENHRERIVFENNRYHILNTNWAFDQEEIVKELYAHPERFSPNVVLRPVYQETILPNVAYIGGGGEIAYWLQLKSNFEAFSIDFPLLFLRNSLLYKTIKQQQKQEKLRLDDAELFRPTDEIIRTMVKKESELLKELEPYHQQLIEWFDEMENIASKTDKTFANMVQAQRAKQLKGMEKLQKRLLKAETKIMQEKAQQVIVLKNELFPQQQLQERHDNFSTFWLNYGSAWIEDVYQSIAPFSFGIQIKTL